MKINKNTTIGGIKIWEAAPEPVKELRPLCRKMAAEGSVLLKNDGVLPLKKGTRVALFGRIQESYIKGGTGSGGLVNTDKQPCILESFSENGVFNIDTELAKIYSKWTKENPFDKGHGWATEPWTQVEMPISKEMAEKFAAKNDVAIFILNRTAGEDRDNSDTEGSYRLTKTEKGLIKNISSAFEKTVVILNVGNIIDLSFLDENNISALLYNWQGGEMGADALADLIAGKISPSGKLPDTQTYAASDYISLDDFGSKKDIVYKEDIYVGYRYFETFAPQKVRYPFGFGLTYTTFKTDISASKNRDIITVTAKVTNTGSFISKEVIEVYFEAPCGKLGTPVKQLIAFRKTADLKPRESEILKLSFNISEMSAYDDSGATGNKSCYVSERGEYHIYAGTDVRSAKKVYSYNVAKTTVTKRLEQALAPIEGFSRLVAKDDEGKRIALYEDVPVMEIDLEKRINKYRDAEIPFTGNKNIKLIDVTDKKHTLDEFVAQHSVDDLTKIVCGEGMNSPKVTGSGSAFGGVTDSLLSFGIPVCSTSDGPSGLRLKGPPKATQIPNGAVFASSFDTKLTEEIFELLGVEMFAYENDTLLAPGMNIHRHPLCGRNFEYFSEDPLLSGKMAAAQTRGISRSGGTATIKHFCCNNQEYGRRVTNSVVSERALREIYLKGFEIAIKEGGATSVMTAYNLINGYHAASNYDLTTTILRKEWGFKGIVMTDWWADANREPVTSQNRNLGNRENLGEMILCQNDIYKVCASAEDKKHNILECLESGYLKLSDLQRSAKNIISFVMNSSTFMRFIVNGCVTPIYENLKAEDMELIATIDNPSVGKEITSVFGDDKTCLMVIDMKINTHSIAQNAININIDSLTVSLKLEGTDGKETSVKRNIKVDNKAHKVSLDFQPAVEITRISIYKQKEL